MDANIHFNHILSLTKGENRRAEKVEEERLLGRNARLQREAQRDRETGRKNTRDPDTPKEKWHAEGHSREEEI